MALKPRTEAHLARADRNRTVAHTLCDPHQTPTLQPPALEWAAVAAFYAAVHYVQAWLWERWGLSPTDHPARRGYVVKLPVLRPILGAYDILADLAFHARYTPTFQPPPAQTRTAVYGRLDDIRALVYQDLGIPAP
jgi:hypothetical protein